MVPTIRLSIKRRLWAAVWSLWAVAGVLAYRELPLDLGDPIARLPIDEASILGFVSDEPLLATREVSENGRTVVRVWNA
jgi:hypothetical protein